MFQFDDDPSIRPSDGLSSRLPIQSARCSHTSSICHSCIMSIKRNKAVEENKHPCKIKWLGCPDCRKKTCYNTEDLIVDIGRCKMLRLLRNKNDGNSTNTSSNSEPSVGGGLISRQTSNENQLNIESQSTETHIDSDEESRFSTMDSSQNDKGIEDEDTAAVVNQTVRQGQQQLRRSKRRKVNTEETINEDGDDDNSNAATVGNEEVSITNEQNNMESGSGEEYISGGDKEDEFVLEEEENVAEDDTSTMSSNNTQLYKIGTKVSKVFFDELEDKLRPYIGTVVSYGE